MMNLFENLQLMNESEEIKTFNISFKRNDIYQANLIKGYSEEQVIDYFKSYKPDAEILGVKVATRDDERPGKPVIDTTKESSILKDEKDIEEIVEAKSSSKSNISKMTYKGQKIQNQDWAEYNVGDYVEIINPINNKSLDIKMGISGYGKLVGKVKDTYVYNDGADNLTAGGQNHNYGELNPSADQSCLIEIHDDFKVSQHGSKTNRIIIPIECLKEIDEKYYKDVINKIPRKGFDKLLNKNKKRIESSILKNEKDMEQIIENTKLKPLTGADAYGWQGANDFEDGSSPLIADGMEATMIVSGSDENDGTAVISIYYGPDGDQWSFKSYEDKESALKDSKILIKLIDEEIDVNQLKRFGFTLV